LPLFLELHPSHGGGVLRLIGIAVVLGFAHRGDGDGGCDELIFLGEKRVSPDLSIVFLLLLAPRLLVPVQTR